MVKTILVTYLVLLYHQQLPAQSARLKAMGDAGTATKNNTIFSNPAGLTETKDISLSVFSENKYLIGGWYQNNFSAVIPIKSSIIGIGAAYNGMNVHNNRSLAVSYSNKLSNEIAFGILLKRSENFIQDYERSNNYNFEFGLLAELAPDFNLGMHLSNPFSAINTYDSRFQQKSIFKFGFSYQPDEILLLIAEIDKHVQNNPNIKLGMEYHPGKPLFIRIGLNTFPFNVFSGFGIACQAFQCDMAISYHPVLGYSPAISLNHSFGKR